MPHTITLNSRGEYAVMAMVELARTGAKTPLPLAEIANNAGISLSYLEQLIAGMRRHHLVKSYRGPGGGYILGKNPDEILIADIFTAAEDCTPAKRTKISGSKPTKCLQTAALWNYVGQILGVTLRKITLEDVLNNRLDSHPHISKLFEIMEESA